MIMWDMHNRTTPQQAEKNRGRSHNGKISAMEDTSSLDDADAVNICVAGSGVVYDIARPYTLASRVSECSHGGHDRCVCGLVGA